MKLEDLTGMLITEHEAMRETLLKIAILLNDGKFEEAYVLEKELESILRQHILDEDSQLLKFIIEVKGRQDAGDSIRVFQEHRRIMKLLAELEDWRRESFQELKGNFDEFSHTLKAHMRSEESLVMPEVLKLLLDQQKESRPALLFSK